MAATPLALSAAVTRILQLTGFPKELKTKDIQSAFAEFDAQAGGFKIKWIDDTSLYIVFQDAGVAKRAYLRTIAAPPTSFSTGDVVATIRPYDGPDAQSVIQAIHARQGGGGASGGGARRSASISVPGRPGGGAGAVGPQARGHAAHASMSGAPHALQQHLGGPPSPSLPDLPTHPTLDALIEAQLGTASNATGNGAAPNRIGDPGKRMIGHALGVRHPGLAGRNGNGGGANGSPPVQAMGGLTIAE